MIASAADGSSSGVRKGMVRSDTLADRESMPGVSMSVSVCRVRDRPSTTSRSTSSGGWPSRSIDSRPLDRRRGSARGRPVRRVQRDPRAGAVLVPGDDACALAGVGGGDLLADQRVEQRRLARLHLPGDGDPQRLVEPVEVVRETCDEARSSAYTSIARRGTQRRAPPDVSGCRRVPGGSCRGTVRGAGARPSTPRPASADPSSSLIASGQLPTRWSRSAAPVLAALPAARPRRPATASSRRRSR